METCKGTLGNISLKSDHEVEWTIDSIFSYTTEDDYYESPLFTISDLQWFLMIYPNGETSENCVGWISLYLVKKDKLSRPVSARFNFGLKRTDGAVEKMDSDLIWVFEDNRVAFGNQFLERSELQQRKSELAPSDSLTVTCTLRTDNYCAASLTTLSKNFGDLLNSQRNCDAILIVEGVEFPVHKTILSARSPLLAALFETDMKDKRTGLVEIEDCDPQAFREFLVYLYSGKIEKGSSHFLELHEIADKYDIPDYKFHCLMSIMANLSVENVLDAAVLGSQLDQVVLIDRTQYIFNQNFMKIVLTDKWTVFLRENPVVAYELLKGLAED